MMIIRPFKEMEAETELCHTRFKITEDRVWYWSPLRATWYAIKTIIVCPNYGDVEILDYGEGDRRLHLKWGKPADTSGLEVRSDAKGDLIIWQFEDDTSVIIDTGNLVDSEGKDHLNEWVEFLTIIFTKFPIPRAGQPLTTLKGLDKLWEAE